MSIYVKFLQAVPVIEFHGQPLALKSAKAEALLAYVFLSGDSIFRRDYLASLLWEDRSLQHARDNLRQTLARIKRTCGDLDGILKVSRSMVEVQKDRIDSDFRQFLADLHDRPNAIEIQHMRFDPDEMLSGFHTVGSAFSSWVQVFGGSVEKAMSDALTQAIERQASPPSTRVKLSDIMLMLDPTNEQAARCKMRYFAEQGQHAEAMRVYTALYHLLDDEYGVEPSHETITLNAAIKMGQLPVQAPKADIALVEPDPNVSDLHAGLQPPPRIFVSPFEFLDHHAHVLRVGKFFQSEVTANLSKFREWTVVDAKPTTGEHYELGCQIIQQDDDVCAVLALRRIPDRRIIWSEQLIIGFEGWNQTQWRITQKISLAINQCVTTDRLRRMLRAKPEDRSVFDKWIMCYSLNSQWSPSASRTAIETLQDITETAPYFGPAHAYLADMYNKIHLVYPGVFRSDDSVRTSLHHAEIAMSLDPLDPNSHRVLAWAKALNGEFDVAEFHFNQAFALNPTHLHVRASSALGFAFLDNLGRACELADETRNLSVTLQGFHWGYFQNIYFLANRLPDAIEAGERSNYAISNVAAWQAAALQQTGRLAEAKTALESFWDLTRQTWQGEAEPDQNDMLTWFLHCFPLRSIDQRGRLEASVRAIMA